MRNYKNNSTSAVKLSDVRLTDIHGTSAIEVAINLAYSESAPCSNIVLDKVAEVAPSLNPPGTSLSHVHMQH